MAHYDCDECGAGVYNDHADTCSENPVNKSREIKHDGGPCPVGGDTLVDVYFGGDWVCHDKADYWTWDWSQCGGEGECITKYRIVSVKEAEQDVIPETGKIVSTGGSSAYYELKIKTKDGEFTAQVGDVIAAMVGDNFALGNVVKALRRIYLDSQGSGKEGVDMSYDINKCKYFLDDFKQRYGPQI